MTQIALFLIATPINDSPPSEPRFDDLSPRAAELLKTAAFVIGEEFRPLTTLLKRLGRERAPNSDELAVLNEHTDSGELSALADRIEKTSREGEYSVLVSDCGTPGFCDPGAPLVAELRRRGLRVSSVPGASSLMCILSLSGLDLKEFVFRGFLPASKEDRAEALSAVQREIRPQVLMDTPYRMTRLLEELARTVGDRRMTLGCDLTAATEHIVSGQARDVWRQVQDWPEENQKREFILILAHDESRLGRDDSRQNAREVRSPQVRSATGPKRRDNEHRPKRR